MVQKRRLEGFSLLEMSIVLLIIAIVIGGSAAIFTASVERSQLDITNEKMRVIQKALLDYRRAFNRIPCPGDLELNLTHAEFGIEAGKVDPDAPECTGGSPEATFTSDFLGSIDFVEYGTVPVRTLGLPDDYAFDGWGRRLVYAVDNRFTVRNAFDAIDISEDTETRIIIFFSDAITQKTTRAAYLLMSHGPNGHGAFTRDGGSRVYVSSTNALEQMNCNCGTVTPNANIYGMFVQSEPVYNTATPRASFDDIIVYATRQNLRLSYE